MTSIPGSIEEERGRGVGMNEEVSSVMSLGSTNAWMQNRQYRLKEGRRMTL